MIANDMYQEHFERESRRQLKQMQEASKVKNVTIKLKHSKEILADKIATAVNQAYMQITSMPSQIQASISREVMKQTLQ